MDRRTPKKRSCAAKEASYNDPSKKYPSHVMGAAVSRFRNSEGKLKTYSSLFKTSLFPDFPGAGGGTPKVIDWVSNQSQAQHSTKYCIRRGTVGSGHSEPQFLSDFRALWTANAPSIINEFVPSSPSYCIASGIELYGSFDVCVDCGNLLRNFITELQVGQQSLASGILNRLRERKIPHTEDSMHPYGFLTYHSHFPYDNVPYACLEEGEVLHPVSYKRDRTKRFESRSLFNFGDSLRQEKSKGFEPGLLYGFIHGGSQRHGQQLGENAFYF